MQAKDARHRATRDSGPQRPRTSFGWQANLPLPLVASYGWQAIWSSSRLVIQSFAND
jgi:hypothetical protein